MYLNFLGRWKELVEDRFEQEQYAVEQDGGTPQAFDEVYPPSYWLVNDRDIVLAAVAQSGMALLDAPEAFRDDYDVVLAAVKERGTSYKYASNRLANDRRIVLAAINTRRYPDHSETLQWAPLKFRDDREIALRAVGHGVEAFRHISERLRGDADVVRAAFVRNLRNREQYEMFVYASNELKDNFQFVDELVSDMAPLQDAPQSAEDIWTYASDRVRRIRDQRRQGRLQRASSVPLRPYWTPRGSVSRQKSV